MYPPEPESKFRENLRYFGYILVFFGGLILLALVSVFIDLIIELVFEFFSFILEYIFWIIIIGFIGGLVVYLFVAGIYLIMGRREE